MHFWQLWFCGESESIQTNHEWERADNLGQRTVHSIQHTGNKMIRYKANCVPVLLWIQYTSKLEKLSPPFV